MVTSTVACWAGVGSNISLVWFEYTISDDDCEWVSDLEGPKVGSRSWSWSFLLANARISLYPFFIEFASDLSFDRGINGLESIYAQVIT